MEKGIGTVFSDCFNNSTAHAVPKIARSKNAFVKILWLCCFAVSTLYCIYSVTLSTRAYLKYPSYVKIEMIQEMKTYFPAVTFCNLKSINKTAASDLLRDMRSNVTEMLKSIDISTSTMRYVFNYAYFMRSIFANSNLSLAEKQSYGYSISSMLLSCQFSYKKCNVDDFATSYSPIFGNCYTFNSGVLANGSKVDIHKTNRPGADYALELEIFVGNSKTETEFELEDGVIVLIHNQNESSFILSDDRIVIPTGANTELKMKKNVIRKLPSPHGNCIKDTSKSSTFSSIYFDYMVRNKEITYNQNHCHLMCLQRHINVICNCSDVDLPPFEDINACATTFEFKCLSDFVKEGHKFDECLNSCITPCNIVKYEITSHRSTYPTEHYKTLLMNNSKINSNGVTYEYLDKAVLKMKIFFDSMVYTKTEEFPSINTETFISNIGGTLGFYLGISILTFVEAVELVFNAIHLFYRRFIKKKVEHSK